MRLKLMLTASVVALLSLLVACSPGAVPSAPVTSAPAAAKAPVVAMPQAARPAWEVEWEKVQEAAKKEGSVVVYSSGGGPLRVGLVSGFNERFGLKVEFVSTRGGQLVDRVLAERRGGIYAADIYMGGSNSPLAYLKPKGVLEPLEPAFILPDITDPETIKKIWWNGKLSWVDNERTLVVFMGDAKNPVVVNTTQVRPGEIKSYKDLLEPKWKGKIALRDPRGSGGGGKWFGSSLIFGIVDENYMRELAKQGPFFITLDTRLLVEWVARGKYALAIAPDPISVQEFKDAGAPVELLPMAEGTYVSSSFGNMALLNKAPHLNAARLWVNWILSKEGQAIWARVGGSESRRLDVPTDHLQSSMIRQPGVKYYDAETEDVLMEIEKLYDKAKEIFGK